MRIGKTPFWSRTLHFNFWTSVLVGALEIISAVNPDSLPENWRGAMIAVILAANAILRCITKEPIAF